MSDDDIYKQLRTKDEPRPKHEVAALEGPDPFQKLVLKVSERFLTLHNDVKQVVDQNFRAIVKAGLGLDSTFGEYRPQRTNGFTSTLTGMIKTLAESYVAKDAAQVFDAIVAEDKKFVVDLRKGLLEAFRSDYHHALHAELKALVEEKRNSQTAELAEEAKAFVKNLDQTIGPVLNAEVKLAQAQLIAELEQGGYHGKSL